MSRTHENSGWESLDAQARGQAERDETTVKRRFWSKLKRHAAGVPFAEDATAAYFAAFDRATPLKVRAALLGALAYFLMPADAMPDILPLIGFGDDAAVLFGAIRLLGAHIQPHHHDAARSALDTMRAEDA